MYQPQQQPRSCESNSGPPYYEDKKNANKLQGYWGFKSYFYALFLFLKYER